MNELHDVHLRPSALRTAGIRERRADAQGLRLDEIEDPALIRVHSLEAPAGARLAALALPGQVGQVGQVAPLSGENLTALCLAPGEWLLVGPARAATNRPPDLAARLQRELASDLTAVCDQSDGLAAIRISGRAAPWLLGKLSCLDFARGTAAGPHCARTRMGDAAVIVHYHPVSGEEWVFDLYVDGSVAHWLWQLLTDSAPHAAELNEDFGVFA
jgi:heterotetrameric sarcosine oxidase gamma subunit